MTKQSERERQLIAANTATTPRRPDHLPLGTTAYGGVVIGYWPDDDDTPVHVVEYGSGTRRTVYAFELKGTVFFKQCPACGHRTVDNYGLKGPYCYGTKDDGSSCSWTYPLPGDPNDLPTS
jgi:hypothetical protein